jgi:hypothetical protein
MKHCRGIVLLTMVVLFSILISCKKEKPSEALISAIGKMYDVGKKDSTTDGRIFYNFDICHLKGDSVIYDNPAKADIKIKGSIDKALGVLPVEELTKHDGELKIYTWETIEIKVYLENTFFDSNIIGPHLNTRIWITEK